jgi:cellulose synthase/poly-beta-1,6-N-acetylglucosamine synthase-like glycosyltransferase
MQKTEEERRAPERGSSTVSVILPVYNDQNTISQSLRSLLGQSYTNLEVIVVNDGSTDKSRQLALEIAGKDPRVKLIDIEHSGTSVAKNSGFNISSGPIIFFAEGDAVYGEDYVSKSIDCLEEDPKLGGVCVLGGIWETRKTYVTKSIDAENQIKHALLHRGKMEPYFAWVFTREALERAGLYDPKLKQAEDRDLFSRVKSAGYQIGLVEGVHWRHRRFETTWQFCVKTFRKGKNRIQYIAKKGLVMEFTRGVAGLWVPIGLALVSLVIPIVAWLAMTSIVVLFLIFYARLLKNLRGTNLGLGQLVGLPLYQIIRYVSTSLGYTYGILALVFHAK